MPFFLHANFVWLSATLHSTMVQLQPMLHVSEQFPTRVLSCDSLEAYRHNSTSLAFTEKEDHSHSFKIFLFWAPSKSVSWRSSWKGKHLDTYLVHQKEVHLDFPLTCASIFSFTFIMQLSWKIWLSKKQSFLRVLRTMFLSSALLCLFLATSLKAHHQCTSHILVVQQQLELDQHLWCSVNAQFGIGLLALGCWVGLGRGRERVVT